MLCPLTGSLEGKGLNKGVQATNSILDLQWQVIWLSCPSDVKPEPVLTTAFPPLGWCSPLLRGNATSVFDE
jgi:hypothetical protein